MRYIAEDDHERIFYIELYITKFHDSIISDVYRNAISFSDIILKNDLFCCDELFGGYFCWSYCVASM